MVKQSKGGSRPIPDAIEIRNITIQLQRALNREENVDYGQLERTTWEVTVCARDGAAHVMRFLKVFFDMPEQVFFTAINYLDRFLAKMKVQEKFLSCICVSCFNLAAEKHGFVLNPSQLVFLSQSKCTIEDMKRMSQIITKKLNLASFTSCTAYDFLQILMDIFQYVAVQFRSEELLNRMLHLQRLCTRLEVLKCDSSCASFKPSTLVLAFIHFEMDRFLSREVPRKSNYYSMEMFYILAVMIELRTLCNVNSKIYSKCFAAVVRVLKDYDSRKEIKYRQKLSWRFSASTHALSKTDYYPMLNTVKEE